MAEIPDRPYDLIVYGATGYSGRLVAFELCRVLKDAHVASTFHPKTPGQETGPDAAVPPAFRWAIAGRSIDRLEALNVELTQVFPQAVLPLAAFACSVDAPAEMAGLTATTVLLLNCAGPFVQCGPPVVEACLRTATHYLDITGEPAFLTSHVWPLHGRAVEAGVYLLPCCGFDCVPAELGTYRLLEFRRNALLESSPTDDRPLNDRDKVPQCVVDTFVSYSGTLSDGTFGTLLSSLEGSTAKKKHSKPVDVESRPPTVHVVLPKLPRVPQHGPWYSRLGKSWVLPLASADPQLVARMFSVGALNPVLQTLAGYRHWLALPGFWSWLRRVILLGLFFRLAKLAIGRRFLRWWRSLGRSADPHGGPQDSERARCRSLLVLRATENEREQRHRSAAKDAVFTARVEGSHVYDVTASAATLAVLCLREWVRRRDAVRDTVPPAPRGGAWTLVSLFAQLPHTVAADRSLLDDFEARMRYVGALRVQVRFGASTLSGSEGDRDTPATVDAAQNY